MQQYAGIYLLQNYYACSGCLTHPSSGVHKTVTAASGTATAFLQRGQIGHVRPVPKAAVTVSCTPDDGCDGHPEPVE